MKCPECGKEIPDGSLYCNYCGAIVKEEKIKTRYTIVAGTLAIISAMLCFVTGFYGIVEGLSGLRFVVYSAFPFLLKGIFGLLGFAFGLAGGILTLERRHFTLSIIGMGLIMLSGVFNSLLIFMLPASIRLFYQPWIFGIPTLIASIIMIAFTVKSRKEFSIDLSMVKGAKRKTAYPTVAGILTIILACTCAVLGIYFWISIEYSYDLILGGFGLTGFIFGLLGGILTLKRRRFQLSIIGIVIMLIIISYFSIHLTIYGIPTIIISILSLIFTAISEKDFS